MKKLAGSCKQPGGREKRLLKIRGQFLLNHKIDTVLREQGAEWYPFQHALLAFGRPDV